MTWKVVGYRKDPAAPWRSVQHDSIEYGRQCYDSGTHEMATRRVISTGEQELVITRRKEPVPYRAYFRH